MLSLRKTGLLFVIPILFFLYQLLTLSHYGVDWDSLNHLPRGQAYFRYFLTGEPNFNKLPEYVEYHQDENTILFSPDKSKSAIPERSIYEVDGYDTSYLLNKDGGHPPTSDIIASLFNFILFQKLKIISDIDSYHIYIIATSAFLVGLLLWWTKKRFGTFQALVALLSLMLYPLFTAESHFNLKDVPEAAFYSAVIIFLYEGLTRKNKSFIIASAVFFGLAWGTKFNILFVSISIIAWLIFLLREKQNEISEYKWLLKPLILSVLISLVIFFGSWPYLWQDPLGHFLNIIRYYKTIGVNTNFNRSFIHLGLNTYALQWILYTTPLVILFFSSLGIFKTMSSGLKEKDKTSLLVFFWFLVPVLRVTVPNAGIYGGVRQIMEFIPPLAILSGIGAAYLKDIIVKRFTKVNHSFITILFILSFVPITAKLISIHPNENVYFNPLIGGLKGAKEKNFPYWGTSFGNPYRQAVSWINSHAEKSATLVLSQELMPNLPRAWVRSDITYANSLRSGYLRNGEYVIGLQYGDPLNQSYYSSRYYNNSLSPIYQIKVDNTAILNIWKNDESHTKSGYLKEEKASINNFISTKNGILIDLQKLRYISRIQWNFSKNQCSDAKLVYFEVSTDNKNWHRTPHTLPDDLPIPIIERQPTSNSLSYPFGAEQAQYIFVNVNPFDSCVKNVKNSIDVYYLPQAGK